MANQHVDREIAELRSNPLLMHNFAIDRVSLSRRPSRIHNPARALEVLNKLQVQDLHDVIMQVQHNGQHFSQLDAKTFA